MKGSLIVNYANLFKIFTPDTNSIESNLASASN